ncbi:glycosyltransferase [Pontibacter sp. BT310]|uniref:Glycosyltransferase n=1 Tax=Pontibacter populi TaxID=890055 RepID=A0ABS6XF85_9BACT|nr:MULTISPECIES: glycosyltransferase [Pontibacter]MBJ6119799.1 glycosyltransferase [Pontibacter sp. BT310]MBR0572228.1 glycosyltransferase [Microvirga sp. STS03]MBW3366652.1 glycosyltransferase [Pontibacter populi]
MKIAFVSLMEGQPWGGSEALWHKTAKYSREQGNDVLVSVYDWGSTNRYIKELMDIGCRVHSRPLYSRNKVHIRKLIYSLKNKILGTSRFYNHILKFKPDMVVISQGNTYDLVIHHTSLKDSLILSKVPYFIICHNHTQFSDIPNAAVYSGARSAFENASKVFFVSKRMWSFVERQLCTKLKNGYLTWNPLNLKSNKLVKWPENSDSLNFAVVASIVGGKGHDMLFEALSTETWIKRRSWILNLYGAGEGVEYLKKLAVFYGIDKKVIFHGHFDNILGVWEHNHILVVPSSIEGLPISLVEAMICGRPAIVTDIGGNCEMIKDGVNGFVAESPYTSYIRYALERAWEKRECWHGMGLLARSSALEQVDLTPEITLYNKLSSQTL